MKTGFVTDSFFLRHRSVTPHPERPERLQAILKATQTIELEHLVAMDAEEGHLLAVHTRNHVDLVRESARRAPAMIDVDTYVHPDSYLAAVKAAGAVITAVDAVMSGACENVFCAVRPPGHHAESDRPMGFCLFNNVAVGARHAQSRHLLKKVAIIDWDVHHGNGTQEIFYEDPSVFYVSTHQYPLYPGTGSRAENGRGAGKGTTRNIPMSAGEGDEAYVRAFEKEIAGAIRDFKPELLMISAGFDAHADDPLAGMKVTAEGFGRLTRLVQSWAEEHCHGRLVSVLEGGYDLQGLGDSVHAHIRALRYG